MADEGLNNTKLELCRAKDKKCLKCRKVGHFAAVCWFKSVEGQRNDGVVAKSGGVDHWFFDALSGYSLEDNKCRVQLKVSGKPVVFKIDTGADKAAMSKSTFDSLPNQPKLHPSRIALFSPGGDSQCAGQFTTTVTYFNKKYEVEISVISGEHASNLLGRQEGLRNGSSCKIGRDGCREVWGHRLAKV